MAMLRCPTPPCCQTTWMPSVSGFSSATPLLVMLMLCVAAPAHHFGARARSALPDERSPSSRGRNSETPSMGLLTVTPCRRVTAAALAGNEQQRRGRSEPRRRDELRVACAHVESPGCGPRGESARPDARLSGIRCRRSERTQTGRSPAYKGIRVRGRGPGTRPRRPRRDPRCRARERPCPRRRSPHRALRGSSRRSSWCPPPAPRSGPPRRRPRSACRGRASWPPCGRRSRAARAHSPPARAAADSTPATTGTAATTMPPTASTRGPDCKPREEQLSRQLDSARTHHGGAQVEIEVALLAAREHHLPALEGVADDQLEQFAALVFHGISYCLRIPSANSAISLVCSSLVPSPNSSDFASSSSRPISYSSETP